MVQVLLRVPSRRRQLLETRMSQLRMDKPKVEHRVRVKAEQAVVQRQQARLRVKQLQQAWDGGSLGLRLWEQSFCCSRLCC